MKKILLSLVLLILVAVAAVPFAGGLLMERTVRSAFDNINAIYGETGIGYSLEVVDVRRGYQSSEIDWKLSFGHLKAMYGIDEILFTDRARHGFTGIVSTTSLEKNPWYAKFVNETLKGRDPLHIETAYAIKGDIESVISLDAFSFPMEEETIQVKAGQMVTVTDKTLKKYRSSGTWQGVTAGEAISIGPVSLVSDLEMISTWIWDGDVTMDIQKIMVQDKGDRMDLGALTVSYTLEPSADRTRLAGETWLAMQGLRSQGLNVENTSVRFVTKGIDTAGYEAFMKMYAKTISTSLAGMESLDEDDEQAKRMMEQQMMATGFQMVAGFEKLLKAGLEFQIADLKVKLPDSEITADIALRLLKDKTFMDFTPIMAKPDLLLDVLYLKSDIRLPVSLVGEMPQLLNPMLPGMQTGLFVKNGSDLIHQAETVDGRLMLNGKELVLAQQ